MKFYSSLLSPPRIGIYERKKSQEKYFLWKYNDIMKVVEISIHKFNIKYLIFDDFYKNVN
jgi:hypothetical protein